MVEEKSFPKTEKCEVFYHQISLQFRKSGRETDEEKSFPKTEQCEVFTTIAIEFEQIKKVRGNFRGFFAYLTAMEVSKREFFWFFEPNSGAFLDYNHHCDGKLSKRR